MLCPNCGTEFENDTKVCPNCSVEVKENQEEVSTEETTMEAVQEEVAAEETTKEVVPEESRTTESEGSAQAKGLKDLFNFKTKLGKIVLGVAGVVVLGIIGISLASGGSDKYNTVKFNEGYYIDVEAEKLVNLDGNLVDVGEDIYNTYNSADGSLTVARDEDDVLYLITKNGAVEIDEDVNRVKVSTYGDTVAYLKEVENGIGELYLYNVSSKKSTLIDEEAYEDIVLSPDGKTVAYVGNCEVDDWYGSLTAGDLFVSKNFKEGEKVYGDSMPVGISNSGKYVYYVKDSEKLYLNDEKISSDFSDEFWFNKDLSELIYNDEGKAKLFFAKKKESVQLKKGDFSSIVAPGELITTYSYSDAYYTDIYDVDTFNETVMVIGNTMYFMSKNGEEVEKISGDISDYQMAADGRGFMYLDYDGDLYYIKDVTKTTDSKKIAEDLECYGFYASEDLKKVYYISDGELFYFEKEKGTRIADAEQCAYSDEFGVIFFVEDEELFYATTSSKSKKKVIGETVNGIEMMADVFLFAHMDDDDIYRIYRMTGKDKYKLIYEEK